MPVIVLDIGKTNLKLLAIDEDGHVRAQRTRPNRSLPGPPWRQLDLADTAGWLHATVGELAREHRAEAMVTAAHGSGGVLVDASGPVLPAIDYEQRPPAAVIAEYARIAPPFPQRGAAIGDGAHHFARQLLWMQRAQPEAFRRGRHFLPLPQYWAWWLTGTAALEPTMLGAQSHLWNALDGCFTGIVDEMGWRSLLPEVGPSWQILGQTKAALGLPAMQVLAGVHDSTANLHFYQAAGLGDATLLSTGTWLVGLSRATPPAALDETRAMTLTSDVAGRPVVGTITMLGREYAAIAGSARGSADAMAMEALVGREVMALPGMTGFADMFPGTAGRGRIVGEAKGGPERLALATLYAALVADVCLDLLRSRDAVIIDGGFVADPAFARLVAALRPDQDVRVNATGGGTAIGAALLWSHVHRGRPARCEPVRVDALPLVGLQAYRRRWREAVEGHEGRPLPAAPRPGTAC